MKHFYHCAPPLFFPICRRAMLNIAWQSLANIDNTGVINHALGIRRGVINHALEES